MSSRNEAWAGSIELEPIITKQSDKDIRDDITGTLTEQTRSLWTQRI